MTDISNVFWCSVSKTRYLHLVEDEYINPVTPLPSRNDHGPRGQPLPIGAGPHRQILSGNGGPALFVYRGNNAVVGHAHIPMVLSPDAREY